VSNEYDVNLPTQALPTPSKKTVQNIMASMVNLEDKAKATAKICISGDQGTGKTTAMMKFLQAVTPADQRIIYVDSGEGWSSLDNFPELKRRVKWMQYENLEQLLVVASALRSGQIPGVGAVLLDEYSTMIKGDRTWIVKARSQQKEIKGEFKDPFQPAQPDYFASQNRSEEVVQAFVTCQIHVGFITHEKLDKDTLYIRPDMAPGAAADFQRLIHSVIRATVVSDKKTGEVTRRFQLQPVGNRVSVKNRIGGLGNFIDNIDELSEAYHKWGASTAVQKETKLTEEQVKEINEDNELLKLLNKEN